jgi:uncharacterized protein
LADALGRMVAQAHATAKPVSGFGFADVLGDILANDHSELRNFSNLFPPADVEQLAEASRAALTRLRPLLLAREKEGLVRRFHGDLHLGNIVLIDCAPVLFDAIEFDERMATVDPLHDLGFLLMDLVARGLKAAANIVLNRYLAESRRSSDLDALAALPLFMWIRAGKSAFARALAPDLDPVPGAVILRSDIERKALFDVPETARLPAAAYTLDVSGRVYAILNDKARRVLAAGHSAVVDAVFAHPEERAGVEVTGLFLTADLPARMARIGGRASDASDADGAVVRAQERYELGPMSWRHVDASGTPEEMLANAVAAMRASP